jgi:inorganic pyrophosphatase
MQPVDRHLHALDRMQDPVRVGPFAEDNHVWVVIETPAGSRTKYKWDAKAQAYRAGRVLPLGMAFPFDFGFIPGTKAEDGDALDALVIADAPLVVGALVECRVLGAYRIATADEPGDEDTVENDRLLCVPISSLRGAEWKNLEDVGKPLADEIEGFFKTYVERQGRKVEIKKRVGPQAALNLVKKSKRRRP